MFEINKLNFNKVYEGVYVMNSFYKDPHLILDLFNKITNKKIGVRATTDKIIAIKVFKISTMFI